MAAMVEYAHPLHQSAIMTHDPLPIAAVLPARPDTHQEMGNGMLVTRLSHTALMGMATALHEGALPQPVLDATLHEFPPAREGWAAPISPFQKAVFEVQQCGQPWLVAARHLPVPLPPDEPLAEAWSTADPESGVYWSVRDEQHGVWRYTATLRTHDVLRCLLLGARPEHMEESIAAAGRVSPHGTLKWLRWGVDFPQHSRDISPHVTPSALAPILSARNPRVRQAALRLLGQLRSDAGRAR